MIRFNIFVFYTLVFLFIIGCSNQAERPNYMALSQDEINQFLEDKSIEHLTVENIPDATVILSSGDIFTLSMDDGELVENSIRWSPNKKRVQLGSITLESPFVYIILNDENLLSKSNKVEVVFSDGQIVSEQTNGNEVFLLFYNKKEQDIKPHIEWQKVNIYDSYGNLIYKEEI